jgi:AraC family transcriptional regulator
MMDKEFRNGLTSAFIARSVGVHPVYLAQVFRRAYGCSISEYLCRRRLEYACFELRGSNTSIAIIAIEAGFYDQGHFSRTFKRLYGITPSEYRRRYGR